MRIIKNAAFEYEKNNITEKNGYIKWYDREKMKRKRNTFMIWMRLIMFLSFVLCAKFNDGVFKVADLRIAVLLVAVFVISVFVIMPLRDVIKLGVVSSGKFNENCLLSCYKFPGSVYNDFVSLKRIVISLIMPLVVFSSIFSLTAIFTQGIWRFGALVMLIISVFITTEDLYILAYCVKRIDENDVVFGEYKKQS